MNPCAMTVNINRMIHMHLELCRQMDSALQIHRALDDAEIQLKRGGGGLNQAVTSAQHLYRAALFGGVLLLVSANSHLVR